jgi:predicted DNA-binding ribbon-helix-helix protein
MSNSPDPNKRVLSVRISREFYRRLQKEARERKMGFNEFIRHLIYEATEHVTLTKQDYEIIEQERQRHVNIKRSNSSGRVPKN